LAVGSLNVIHDQVKPSLILTHLTDPNDMRVIELIQDCRFAFETFVKVGFPG
jgi:hypothetical protein